MEINHRCRYGNNGCQDKEIPTGKDPFCVACKAPCTSHVLYSRRSSFNRRLKCSLKNLTAREASGSRRLSLVKLTSKKKEVKSKPFPSLPKISRIQTAVNPRHCNSQTLDANKRGWTMPTSFFCSSTKVRD